MTEVEVGENYIYKCQAGLVAKEGQDPTVTCLPDGSWSSTQIICVCTTPPAKSRTINETIEVEVGHNYTYKCEKGLVVKARQNPTVTCLPDGSWTSTNFTCVCTPPARSGTINGKTELEIGQNYTYKCQTGLVAKAGQNPTVTCLKDDSWASTNFTCVCETPPSKSGAIIEMAEVEVGQNYNYQCQDGLFAKGDLNPTITCLENGSWTSKNVQCVKQNWEPDIIYPNNIHTSDVISAKNGIDLLACMQQCDDYPINCLSFFYDNIQCVLSYSYKRGLPQHVTFSSGLVYYTVPSASCDMGYVNVSLGGAYFCIKLHFILKTFNEAMKVCESEKGKLLVVTSMAQIADLKKTVSLTTGWTYVGISDEIKEGNWTSWNGEVVYPIWNMYEPNGGTSENCGVISPTEIGLNDQFCGYMHCFVCNKI